MASSTWFAPATSHDKSSVTVMLVALYAMVLFNATGPAMASGTSNSTSTAKNMQNRLVQALKEKGEFTTAATFLGAVDLGRLLPESSTLLVPVDDGVTASGLQFSTFNTALPILQYHVITRRLAFRDLELLPEGEMLQTLLPNNTVIITSNSSTNFSVDDVPLSHKNLFLASSTVVHGISGVLSFATYGKMRHLHDFPPSAPPGMSPVGAEPAHQQLGPPSSAANSSSSNINETRSSPSPVATGDVSVNSSFPAPPSPPQSPGASQAGRTSPSTPVSSLPIPTPPSKPLNSSPSTPSTEAHAPASPQHALPLFQSNCDGDPFFLCSSPSSSHQLKPWSVKGHFSVLLLLPGVLLLAQAPAMSFKIFVILLIIAAAPAMSGEIKDASEVLRARGGFGYAATYLEALDMDRVLPNRSTVLVPTAAALDATGMIYNTLGDALMPTLQYHVVTKELLFKDLQKLPVGATLLPKSSLLIPSNAAWNFTVNNVLLSHPDMFCFNGTAIDHGIAGVFINFSCVSSSTTAYNGGLHVWTPPLPPELIFPLPEIAAPFAAPLPVSQASLVSGLIALIHTSCHELLSVEQHRTF